MPDLKDAEAADYRQRLDAAGASRRRWSSSIWARPAARTWPSPTLAAAEPFATTAREVTFSAQVRNFGTQPRNHHLVELHVDGQRVKETYVDVAAGEQAPIVVFAIASTRRAITWSRSGWAPTCWTSTTIAGCRCR